MMRCEESQSSTELPFATAFQNTSKQRLGHETRWHAHHINHGCNADTQRRNGGSTASGDAVCSYDIFACCGRNYWQLKRLWWSTKQWRQQRRPSNIWRQPRWWRSKPQRSSKPGWLVHPSCWPIVKLWERRCARRSCNKCLACLTPLIRCPRATSKPFAGADPACAATCQGLAQPAEPQIIKQCADHSLIPLSLRPVQQPLPPQRRLRT